MQVKSRALGLFVAGLIYTLSAGATQGETSQNAQVDAIATAIQSLYFNAARGAQIAANLRAAANHGEFDKLADSHGLALALTDRLQPFDRHFRVTWDALDSTPPHLPPTGPRMRMHERNPAADDRDGYGIRSVEVQSGNIGYIELSEFADFEFGRPDEPARRAIETALHRVWKADAIIIDVRENRGGSPAMVGYLVSAFTPKGANIYNTFRRRDGSGSEAPRDAYAHPRLSVPLYILISARTVSAAESFAYTLKNARRATIVGETSGGAANPGGPVNVGNGFSVFVPTGSPISPITNTNWEGTGVAPDVKVAPAAALGAARTLALQALNKRSEQN